MNTFLNSFARSIANWVAAKVFDKTFCPIFLLPCFYNLWYKSNELAGGSVEMQKLFWHRFLGLFNTWRTDLFPYHSHQFFIPLMFRARDCWTVKTIITLIHWYVLHCSSSSWEMDVTQENIELMHEHAELVLFLKKEAQMRKMTSEDANSECTASLSPICMYIYIYTYISPYIYIFTHTHICTGTVKLQASQLLWQLEK